jgi:hypothetical protein
MPQSSVHRTLNGLGIALAVFPLAILFIFYAYVVRTRLAVGYWPSYGHPESWSQGFTVHYAVLRPWFLALPLWFLPVAIAVYEAFLWATSREFPRVAFTVLGISTAIVYGCFYGDPGKFVAWFLD